MSERDLIALLDIVHATNDVESLDELRQAVPSLVRSLVPADLAGWSEVDPDARTMHTVFDPPSPDLTPIDEIGADVITEHPVVIHQARTGDGSARTISDFWTERQFRSSALYEQLYRPIGAADQLAVGLPSPRPLVIGIPLNRDRWGSFTRRDRAVMDLVRPHLAQSYVNVQVREELQARVELRDTALAADGRGVVLLRGQRVIDASSIAADELRALGATGPTALPHELVDWLRRERHRNDPGTSPTLSEPYVAERGASRTVFSLLRHDLILVQVLDESPSSEALQRLGLTPRQAEVLALVVRGATTDEAARTLDIRPATVKKHLEAVHRKLGVQSRTQAVALVYQSAPRLRA